MKHIALLLLAALALLAAGCLDTKQEFTLNPDGSGKVVEESVFLPLKVGVGEDDQSPEAQLREAVRAELQKAVGVDAWKDVTFRRTNDGRIAFKGTAYFKDLARLRLHNNGFDATNLQPSLAPGGASDLVLELGAEARRERPAAAKPPTAPLAAEELARRITGERAKYQQMRPVLMGFFADLKMELTFHLPGVTTAVNNFQPLNPQTVTVKFTGAKMLEVVDAMAKDDGWWRTQLLAGKDFAKDGPDLVGLNEQLFGQKGPIRALFRPAARPLFDYPAEVAAARQAYPAILQSLGAAAALAAPPAPGGAFQRLRVGGIRLVTITDAPRGVRPFNAEAGCTLALIGDLPGAALAVLGGRLERAVADNGDDLRPERDTDREISSPRLSQDRTTVVFEVQVALPDLGVRALRELAGTIEYVVGGAPQEVDLGITAFAAGSRGQRYGAVVRSVGESKRSPGSEQLELYLDLLKPAIKSVMFYDAAGNKLDTSAAGATATDTTTTLRFTVKGKFPPKGRVVAEVYDLEKRALAFTLANIPLPGPAGP